MHPRAPWGSVTFAGAYWNCADRLKKLLTYVRPWFKQITIAVQEAQSEDDRTLEVAKSLASRVIEDKWVGRGDPSIHNAVAAASTPWVFVISDDEWPSEDLLDSFQDLVETLQNRKLDGAWIHFRSTIDGIDFTREQDNHLRFFRAGVPWPTTQHARPMLSDRQTMHWPHGFISHDRTLDEMMVDYLRRYDIGLREHASEGQMSHNRRMMFGATDAVALRKGAEYVKSFPWWPQVRDLAWEGKEPTYPTPQQEEPPADPVASKSRRRAAAK